MKVQGKPVRTADNIEQVKVAIDRSQSCLDRRHSAALHVTRQQNGKKILTPKFALSSL